MLPLDEIFREWRKIYLEMIARGLSTQEALEEVSRLMVGEAE